MALVFLPLINAASVGAAHAAGSTLDALFLNPPAEARPRVWWHWLDGDISQHGIDADLAWMHWVGLGGVQQFDGAFNMPLLVPRRVEFMTPEWQDDFRHAVATAKAQGFEFSIASSPGWSESGGPWVRPEQAMKKMVWSETAVQGGGRFTGTLMLPSDESGPFGNLPIDPGNAAKPRLYRDSVVLAFRTPANDAAPPATVTASAPIDPRVLGGGDLNRFVTLPFGAGDGRGWIRFDYGSPVTIRALTLAAEHAGGLFGFFERGPSGRVEASDDGTSYRAIAALPTDPGAAPEQTIAFAPVTARVFRVTFDPRGPNPAFPGLPPAPTPVAHRIAKLVLQSSPHVDHFEDKAGWSVLGGLGAYPTAASGSGDAVASASVIDLTGRLGADGHLDWTPPPGAWVVVRMGWSLTGVTNHPASHAGTGLEVDKLNRADVHAYVDNYLGIYTRALGGEPSTHGVTSLVTDSYEAGAANWTDDILDQFKARRGYAPLPYLPVLTGRVVDSAAKSDAFLWDFRRTLSDLIAEAHYGEISAMLHARGMRRYGESHESGRAFIGDGMEVKKSADLPMGAMWAASVPIGEPTPTNYDADLRESASVAHLYGQNLVAAESFNAGGGFYAFTPARLKPLADRMLVDGVNHFSVHTSVHQPVDTPGPGLTLASVGQWFTRKETWAEMAGPWVTYLARSSALLQQGRAVRDVLWFYGEDDNITLLYGRALPPVPPGYSYDFVNADALTHLVTTTGGTLNTPAGARYGAIVLGPETRRMSLPVLRRLRALVEAGATLVGAKPQVDISLADDPREFQAIANSLWNGHVGRGRVLPFGDLEATLARAGLAPDVGWEAGTTLGFIHRTLPDSDIYFVSNPGEQRVVTSPSFRVHGRAAEIWRADTAAMTPAAYASEPRGRTRVTLDLAPHDAVFVVFRTPVGAPQRSMTAEASRPVRSLDGAWTVTFPPDAGAPATVRLAQLGPLSARAEPGVRYFSGIASYHTSFTLPASAFVPGHRLRLDLGQVANVAEVLVNGRSAGVAWHAPFAVDITDAAHPGGNDLVVKVADLWVNRLIGDHQPGATGTHAFATFDPFNAASPLEVSGLLGPVQVVDVAPSVGR